MSCRLGAVYALDFSMGDEGQLLPTRYACAITPNGVVCGKCGVEVFVSHYSTSIPCSCTNCGVAFEYQWQTDSLEAFYANSLCPGRIYFSHDGHRDSGLHQADIGPTTACFDCGAIIPIGDCFYSSTVDQRALCEGCYGKAEKAGRAKCLT